MKTLELILKKIIRINMSITLIILNILGYPFNTHYHNTEGSFARVGGVKCKRSYHESRAQACLTAAGPHAIGALSSMPSALPHVSLSEPSDPQPLATHAKASVPIINPNT
ncbi:unnamed protein product, partial [Musa hybrid cultivar]